MSHKATQWVYTVIGLTAGERLVLGFLAMSQNSETLLCNPSVAEIMSSCELSRSTVFRALQTLGRLGLITIERKYRGHWQRPSQIYLHQNCPYSPGQNDTPPGQNDTPPGQNDTPLNQNLNQKINRNQIATPSEIAIRISDLSELEIEKDEEKSKNQIKNKNQILSKTFPSGEKVKISEFLKESQKTLTFEQALHKAKKGGVSYTGKTLQGLWRDLHAVFNIDVYFAPLSAKEAGQFGQLRKKMAMLDLGPVMGMVVGRWNDFGKYLKNQGIVSEWPKYPHVGFFLKHAELAVTFYQHQKAVPTSIQMKPFVIPS